MKSIVVGFLIIFVVYLIVKSALFRKKFQKNPAAFLSSKSFPELVSWVLFLGTTLLYGMIIAAYYVEVSLGEMNLLYESVFNGLGVALLILGFAVMVKAHSDMGEAWRMGTDDNSSVFVKRGLFKVSRNPVYMGIILMTLGLFLVMQNLAALGLWFLLLCIINYVVWTEEKFLQKKFAVYSNYKKKVPRFL